MVNAAVEYRDIDPEAYCSLLAESNGATVFHSLDWMAIYDLFSPSTSQLLVCAWDQDTLLAAMPVSVFRKLCVPAVFSSGFSLYGGRIMCSSCEPSVLDGLLRSFERTFLGRRTSSPLVAGVSMGTTTRPGGRLVSRSVPGGRLRRATIAAGERFPRRQNRWMPARVHGGSCWHQV